MASFPSIAPESSDRKPVAAAWHTVLFILVLLGISYLQHLPRFQARVAQAPSKIPTYLQTIVFELLLLGYVWLLGLKLYKIPMRDLIGGRWNRWLDFWKDLGAA